MPPQSTKDKTLCQMFSRWNCRSPRHKEGLYCLNHTCEAGACKEVVASPKQRYCEKHQLNKLLPQSPSQRQQGPVASLKPLSNSPPQTRPRANAVVERPKTLVVLPQRAPIKGDAEYTSVLNAVQAVVQEPGFQTLWQKETSKRGRFRQFLDQLANHVMLSDLQWQAVVNFLQAQTRDYAQHKRHFAYDFCQDLLCYSERKVDEAQIEFVVFGTTMLVFPLLAPYLAMASGAAAVAGGVKGAIAAKATQEALEAGQKLAKAGANWAAKRAELGEEQTRLVGRPAELLKSQGNVDMVLEKISTVRGNPLLFARLLSRYLASSQSTQAAKEVINHFQKARILSWDHHLDPGEYDV